MILICINSSDQPSTSDIKHQLTMDFHTRQISSSDTVQMKQRTGDPFTFGQASRCLAHCKMMPLSDSEDKVEFEAS